MNLRAEVPPKKRTEALIEIYRNKTSGEGEKLELIFNALIKLSGEDRIEGLLMGESEIPF